MTGVKGMPRHAPVATGRYLGYTLLITERTVTVVAPSGREIGVAYTVAGARRIVRGYRSGSKR